MPWIKFGPRWIQTDHIDLIHVTEKTLSTGATTKRYKLEMDNNSTQEINGEQGDYLLGVLRRATVPYIDEAYNGSNAGVR